MEFHASARPEANAVTDGARAITFRELNARANLIARRLRRTNVVLICLPRSIELAILMLGTLKAGGAYCWIDPARASDPPHVVAILQNVDCDQHGGLPLDLESAFDRDVHVTPNLPVMTRGSDTACVIADGAGKPAFRVPHATLSPLQSQESGTFEWSAVGTPFALWTGLLSGATVTIESPGAAEAAA